MVDVSPEPISAGKDALETALLDAFRAGTVNAEARNKLLDREYASIERWRPGFAEKIRAALSARGDVWPEARPIALERSDNLAMETVLTVRSSRGEEYIVNADALAAAFAECASDLANEQRFGWTLNSAWWRAEFEKLRKAALPPPPAAGEPSQ